MERATTVLNLANKLSEGLRLIRRAVQPPLPQIGAMGTVPNQWAAGNTINRVHLISVNGVLSSGTGCIKYFIQEYRFCGRVAGEERENAANLTSQIPLTSLPTSVQHHVVGLTQMQQDV